MNKIFKSGNYVIAELASGAMYELGGMVSDYKHRTGDGAAPDFLEIRERALVQFSITETEATAGDWEDDNAVAYDWTTLQQFLRNNTGFNTAPGGSGAVLITENVVLASAEFAVLRFGVQLLPTPAAGTWQDIKEIIYKYKYGTAQYFGLNTGNVLGIYGGGIGSKYQIQTTRDIFHGPLPEIGQPMQKIWKQFPETRFEAGFLAYNPEGVFDILGHPPGNPLMAYFSRENLTGGDGVLEMEIIYEVKDI